VIAFGVMSENQVELPKGFTNPDEIRVIPDPVYYDSLNVQGKKKNYIFDIIFKQTIPKN
jgi:hypothetical protein